MAEPTVVCPPCKSEIKLTESLAAPLLESNRRNYEQRLSQKDADMVKREKSLHERETILQKEKASLDELVAQRIRQNRPESPPKRPKKPNSPSGMSSIKKPRKLTIFMRFLNKEI